MMRHVNLKLLAASACALTLVATTWGPAWAPAWAEEAGPKQEAKQEDGFLDGMADDAGNFFSDVGSFFSDDVPEFFTEDVPAAFSDDEEAQASVSGADPFAGKPKLLTDKASIKQTQSLLNDKGYEAGTADGIVGRNTRSAIRAYQKDNELRVTGTVTDQLLLHLKGVRPQVPSVAEAPKPEKPRKRAFTRDQ